MTGVQTCALPIFKDNRQLASILRKALAHDAKNRYASAGAMRDDLKKFIASFEEAPTEMLRKEDVEEDATVVAPPRFAEEDEAATKPANLFKMEQEAAQIAAQQAAAAELEKKRVAAEALEKKRAEDEKVQQQQRAQLSAEEVEKIGRAHV